MNCDWGNSYCVSRIADVGLLTGFRGGIPNLGVFVGALCAEKAGEICEIGC